MRDWGPGHFIAILAVIALGLITWLVFIRSDGSDDGLGEVDKPHVVDASALSEFAGSVGHAVYWAGPINGTKLELTNTSDGRVYVRYLTTGSDTGDPRPAYLTVGTYPVTNPLGALHKVSRGSTYTRIPLQGGGLATYDQQRPSSVYVAVPGSDYEIEVFDPSPQQAIELVTTRKIQPVPSAG